MTILIAPPWTGKSHVSACIDKWLHARSARTDRIHAYRADKSSKTDEFRPPWWEEWKDGAGEAYWLIDGLDELQLRAPRVSDEIVDVLQKLTGPERARLKLLITCRENEVPNNFIDEIRKVYSSEEVAVRLAPLDRNEARRILKDESQFERICLLSHRYQLRAIAGLPAVVRELEQIPADQSKELTVGDVWRRLIVRLAKEASALANRKAFTAEKRVDAAQRIALALVATGCDEIVEDDVGGPSLANLFGTESILLAQARDALVSGLFQRTSTGYRICQRNVCEWLCAFELSRISLGTKGFERIRSLVADGSGGISNAFKQSLRLFAATGDTKAHVWVKDILLREAISIIDSLERAAGKAERPIWQMESSSFGALSVPGVSSELRSRLRDTQRTVPVRMLLMEIAKEISATNVDAELLSIADDAGQPVGLRKAAIDVLRYLASSDSLKKLESIAMRPNGIAADLKAKAILTLLERKVWTHTQARSHAPESTSNVVDNARMLQYVLGKNISLEDAAAILFHERPEGPGSESSDTHELWWKAMDVMLSQDNLPDLYVERSASLLLGIANVFSNRDEIKQRVGNSLRVRRQLFLGALGTGDGVSGLTWWIPLSPEDALFVLDVAKRDKDRTDALCAAALSLAHRDGAGPDLAEKVEREISVISPKAIEIWEKEVESEKSKVRRLDRQVMKLPIQNVVDQTLKLDDRGVRLQRLGWVCFLTNTLVRPTSKVNLATCHTDPTRCPG